MKKNLPIDDSLDLICQTFQLKSALIIQATPGSGKTTRVPVVLAEQCEKQIWVLEPRRIAAISAATYIAEEMGWTLGQEVGYQVRFEQKSSASTQILFLTEALLLRKLIQDPQLSQVGCVILDEFHERSVHVDLALGALKELQELSRPDLKIVVMSATLDSQPLLQFLPEATVITVQGQVFPLAVRYEDKSLILQTGFDFIERIKKIVLRALFENKEGDVLCFLPGRGEIERVYKALAEVLPTGCSLFTLHGQLPLAQQRQALLPIQGARKIILSTNIAESSLTVEGVRLVVDSGLVRLQQQNQRTGFESLILSRISKASATQRAGRAARLGPGVVYRAWSVHEENSMAAFESSEVQRVDLSESLLLLAALGISEPESFTWFEKPPLRKLQIAQDFLKKISALDSQGLLTELGRQLREYPLHPRLALLLIEGQKLKISDFAAQVAVLLSESRSGADMSTDHRENDILIFWESWRKDPSHPRFKSLDRTLKQIQQLMKNTITSNDQEPSMEQIQKLFLSTYPDRLCRRRREGSAEAKMVGGRGVKIHPQSSVKQSEFFLAIEVHEGREATHALVFLAVGLSRSTVEQWISPLSKPSLRVVWDEEQKRFWAIEYKDWQGLSVGGEQRRPATTEEISEQLVDVCFVRWNEIISANEELAFWLARLEHLHRCKPEWPLLSEEQVREALALASFGENSLISVSQKNLIHFLEPLLSEAHREVLNRECPSHWIVPTGNRYRIRYSPEQGPQLEVRLQELFGLQQSPQIAGQSLTLFLLAPNYRPVQVTRDLQSFWKNGYPEVRKEMRARYPKHSWPEDPLTAPPQSKGRPRQG